MNKMINLSSDQYLVAECTAELAKQLTYGDMFPIFCDRFGEGGALNEFLVGVALVIENQVKLAGGWDILDMGYSAFVDYVVTYIFGDMHNHSELDAAFLKSITRFVQEMIDLSIKEGKDQ